MNAKILESLMVLAAVGLLTGAAIQGYPCPGGADASNSFGERFDLELSGSEGDSTGWIMDPMAPGDAESGAVALDHVGDIPVDRVEVSFDVTVNNFDASTIDEDFSDRGDMDSQLIVTSMEYGGKGILEKVKAALGGGDRLTLAELDGKTLDGDDIEELKGVPPADGHGGTTKDFEMTVKFDEGAGNGYQNDSVDLEIAFTLSGVSAAVPMLISPSDGSLIDDDTPDLLWNPAASAENHRVLVDDDPDFTSPEENVLLGADASEHVTGSILDGTYRWKVVAIKADAENESEVYSFEVDTTPPSPFGLISPKNDAILRDRSPNLKWEASSGLHHYEIWLDGSNVENSPAGGESHATTFLDLGGHSWYVVAVDRAGNERASKDTFSFKIETVPAGPGPGPVGPTNDPPVVDFAYSPSFPTTENYIQFIDNSRDPDGSVEAWSWSFGDGSSSDEENPTHRYSESGTYTVSLTVADDDGASANLSKDVVVEGANEHPIADAGGPYSVPSGETLQLDGTGSMDPDGTITSYLWTIVDDPTGEAGLTDSGSAEPTFHAPSVDTQVSVVLKLTVTDDGGAEDSDESTVTVEAPRPGFVVSDLEIDPEEAGPDEEVRVSAKVINRGEGGGTFEVIFSVEGEREDSRTVSLGPHESTTVRFTTSRGEEGSYEVKVDVLSGSFDVKPAAMPFPPWEVILIVIILLLILALWYWRRRKKFVVSDLEIDPEEAGPDEEVRVSAKVINRVDREGSYEIVFTVDGRREDTETVALGPEESATIQFTTSRGEEGSYEVKVDVLSGSFEVIQIPID